MKNSILKASRSNTLANMAPVHVESGPDDRTDRRARLRFLMESAAYLGLNLGRDELDRRFLWQPARGRCTARA